MTEPRFTEAQVLMIPTTAVLYPLPPDLRAVCRSEEWWQRLVCRSWAELTVEHRRMLDALNVPALKED